MAAGGPLSSKFHYCERCNPTSSIVRSTFSRTVGPKYWSSEISRYVSQVKKTIVKASAACITYLILNTANSYVLLSTLLYHNASSLAVICIRYDDVLSP